MKKLLFVLMALFLFQRIAYTDELKGKGKKFEQNKAWIIEQTNKKITILKAFEGCAQSEAKLVLSLAVGADSPLSLM